MDYNLIMRLLSQILYKANESVSWCAQGLRYENKLQHPVRWWRYSHDSRLALQGTGELGLWLQVRQRHAHTNEGRILIITLKGAWHATNVYAEQHAHLLSIRILGY